MNDAEAAIGRHMHVAATLSAQEPTGQALLAPNGLFRGKVFVSDDRHSPRMSEQVAIFEAPPAMGARVVGISRTVELADNTWDQLTSDLVKKYGPWTSHRPLPYEGFVWADGRNAACTAPVQNWVRWASSPEFEGRKIEQILNISMPLPTKNPESYAPCGPTLTVGKGGPESEADGLPLYRFTTTLVDTGVVADLVAKYLNTAPAAGQSVKVKL